MQHHQGIYTTPSKPSLHHCRSELARHKQLCEYRPEAIVVQKAQKVTQLNKRKEDLTTKVASFRREQPRMAADKKAEEKDKVGDPTL